MRCLSVLALCACAVAATASSKAAFLDVTSPGDDVAATQLISDGSLDPYTNFPGPEGPAQSIDDDTGSKYLSFQGAGLNNAGELETSPTGFVVVLDSPAAIGGVQFTTANDYASRDPGIVQIYGTNMAGSAAEIADTAIADDLTLVYDGTTGIPAYSEVGGSAVTEGRYETAPAQYFPESAEYGAYVVIITDLVRYEGNAPTNFQFSEVALLQVPEPSTLALVGLGGLGLIGLARRRVA